MPFKKKTTEEAPRESTTSETATQARDMGDVLAEDSAAQDGVKQSK